MRQLRPHDIRAAFGGSCRRLGADYIDIYFVHWPNVDLPLADAIGELERLRDAGKIRAVGVSNFTADELAEAGRYGRIDVLQPPYNLFWRFSEQAEAPYCRAQSILRTPAGRSAATDYSAASIQMRSNGLRDAFDVLLRRFSEFCNRDRAGRSTLLAFALNPIDLVQGPRGQITLATAWATDDWHVLDHEELIPLAITARDMPNPRARFAAVIADPQIV